MKNLVLFFGLFLVVSCSSDEVNNPSNPNNPGSPTLEGEVWAGPIVAFSKSSGADPNDADNQDRITDNVWITRGNNGGQIFNAKTESSANKNSSPANTLWARGKTDNVNSLSFSDFRTAVGDPKDVVGKDLVLYSVQDKIFIDVKFSNWTAGKNGGFAYERSSE